MVEQYLAQAFVWRYDKPNYSYLHLFAQEANALYFLTGNDSSTGLTAGSVAGGVAGGIIGSIAGALVGSAMDASKKDPPLNGNLLTLAQSDHFIVNRIMQVTSISETKAAFKITCRYAILQKNGAFSEIKTATIPVGKTIRNLNTLMAQLCALRV